MNKRKTLLSVATALVLPVASATDLPSIKEGLWSVHTQTINNPGNKKSEGNYTLCRNHAFDQSVQARAKTVKGCTMVSETLQSGKYSSEMKCLVSGTAVDSKGTTTYTGDDSFHSETHATYTPAMYGMSESTIIMDQKYVGGCPAGIQPGDRTNADGTVLHLGKQTR